MTIKYNVTGAKARNGKEIAPMAFGDHAEAERFAKYHEGLSVPQNLRKHPGSVSVTGTYSSQGHPQNIPKYGVELKNHPVSAKCLALHLQQVGRVERKSPPVTIVVDPKVLTAGIEEPTGPVQVLKLPKEIIGELMDPLDNESDADKYAACEDAMKMNDNMRKCGTIDVPQPPSAQEKLEWLQKANTLHRQVNILYVVDGYEVILTWDEKAISEAFHGQTVEEAIEKAMAGHDLDIRHAYHAHEFQYQMDRQLIALEAENENLRRSATVGNADLEAAYEMGFLAATQRFTPFVTVDYTESQDYADQRRSDLKELVSYDRSK